VFADLLAKYPHVLPDDRSLRFDLIQRGFSPASAETVLVVLKDSVAFAGYFEGAKPASAVLAADPAPTVAMPVVVTPAFVPLASASSTETRPFVEETQQLIAVQSHLDQIPIRLPGGRRAWLVIPSPFYEADKKRLKSQIDILLTDDESPSVE